MAHQPDRRTSATVNAALVLVLALVPLGDFSHSTSVDHREQRPWGCRSCPIPPGPAVQQPEDRTL
jgi:hypothetical protein